MKTFLSFLFSCLLISCSQTEPGKREGEPVKSLVQKDNLLFPIEGKYVVQNDSLSSEYCEMSIEIIKKNNAYQYHLKTSEKDTVGNLSIKLNENKNGYYINLEGIQWTEYGGDIDGADSEKDLELPVGINAVLNKDEIIIQNDGNSMNYYVKLGECGLKYIRLKKR